MSEKNFIVESTSRIWVTEGKDYHKKVFEMKCVSRQEYESPQEAREHQREIGDWLQSQFTEKNRVRFKEEA